MKNVWIPCNMVWSNDVFYNWKKKNKPPIVEVVNKKEMDDYSLKYQQLTNYNEYIGQRPNEIYTSSYLKKLHEYNLRADEYLFANCGGFSDTTFCKPGVIIKYEDGNCDIIGDICTLGGGSDEFTISDDTKIIAYYELELPLEYKNIIPRIGFYRNNHE